MTDKQFAREFNVDKYLEQEAEKERTAAARKAVKKPAGKKAGKPVSQTPTAAEVSAPMPISRAVLSIEIDKITVPPRLRAVDDDVALGIADSMAINGQQSPIEISPPDGKGNHFLIAGAHRLQAAKINGWSRIDATLFSGSPEECRLREIDENLLRRELSPLDRATFLAERKRLYEEMHPETKAGAAGAAARWHASAKFAFASETAEKCGLSERSIQLAIQRFNRIAPDVRERIALTWLANKGTELDALAKLEPDEQRKAVDLVLSGAEGAPKGISAAADIVRGVRKEAQGDDAADAAFRKFLTLWKSAPEKARDLIVSHLIAKGYCAPIAGETRKVA